MKIVGEDADLWSLLGKGYTTPCHIERHECPKSQKKGGLAGYTLAQMVGKDADWWSCPAKGLILLICHKV